jgi:ATP-binding cassette, subfamily B, bacterial
MTRRLGDLGAAFRLAAAAAPVAVFVYCALSLVAGLGPVIAATLTRTLFDGLTHGSFSRPVVAALVGVGVVVGVLPAVRGHLRSRMLREVAMLSMDRLYAAMDRLTGIGRLENPTFRDELRLAQQSGRSGPGQVVDDALGGAEAAITLCGFLGLLIGVHLGLAVVVLAAAVPALLIQIRLNRNRAAMMWGISGHARREAYYGDLLTSLPAAKELRLLRLGGLFRSRMRSEMAYANDAQGRQDRRELGAYAGLAALTAVIAGAGLLWGVAQVAAGRLTIGDLTVLAAAIAAVQMSAQALVQRIGSAHHAVLLFGHYRALEAAAPDLPVPAAAAAIAGLTQGIELTDVWFRYAPDKPWVLRGVTFSIPYGQTVALVGLNGAGKSTLIKLLCRFYDPTLGTIRWDGRDIRRMRVEELRARIGAVFQDFMQYDLSAAENVGIGDVATLGDLERASGAARLAGVHDTLQALPRGYETLLSNTYYDQADRENPETGVLLSGGQWQRVAMARAFLRDELDLMILDEPTSGLDAQAEHELHRRLRERRAGRTSVLISHRLGTVRDADLIVVLADGKVTESGRHDELLAVDGGYARLFRLQATGYAREPA